MGTGRGARRRQEDDKPRQPRLAATTVKALVVYAPHDQRNSNSSKFDPVPSPQTEGGGVQLLIQDMLGSRTRETVTGDEIQIWNKIRPADYSTQIRTEQEHRTVGTKESTSARELTCSVKCWAAAEPVENESSGLEDEGSRTFARFPQLDHSRAKTGLHDLVTCAQDQ